MSTKPSVPSSDATPATEKNEAKATAVTATAATQSIAADKAAEAQDLVARPQRTLSLNAPTVAPQVIAARNPKKSPGVRWWAILLSLLLLALAGVLGREIWVLESNTNQGSWLQPILNWFANPARDAVLITAGIGAAILGLWLLLSVLKPAPLRHIKVSSSPAIWMRRKDIETALDDRVRSVPGVTEANVSMSKSSVSVKATQEYASALSSAADGDASVAVGTGPVDDAITTKVQRTLSHLGLNQLPVNVEVTRAPAPATTTVTESTTPTRRVQ